MKKTDFMEYKGYYGSVHFDIEAEIFYGKVEFIRDLINYEATDAKSLIKAFQQSIEDYIADCVIHLIKNRTPCLKAVLM